MVLQAQRSITEGAVSFDVPDGSKLASTWYRIVGDLSNFTSPPLVLLPGGPGAGHDYLSSFVDLHDQHNIPLVFYDQIGSGKSTHFRKKEGDKEFWTIDLFLRELDNLIDHLGLRSRGFSLLGQSFGGVLAGSYAARRPLGLEKAIIASGPADISLYIKGTRTLLAELPEEVRSKIEGCERRGDFESPEYEAAIGVFANRHVYRLDPWPQPLLDTFANLKDDPTAYLTMQGPSDFHVVGSMKGWEGWSKAHLIDVPVLLTNGSYDEVQDIRVRPWFDECKNVKWVQFAESSHMPHWEERTKYMKIVGEFLEG